MWNLAIPICNHKNLKPEVLIEKTFDFKFHTRKKLRKVAFCYYLLVKHVLLSFDKFWIDLMKLEHPKKLIPYWNTAMNYERFESIFQTYYLKQQNNYILLSRTDIRLSKSANFWLNFKELWSFLTCMKKINTFSVEFYIKFSYQNYKSDKFEVLIFENYANY